MTKDTKLALSLAIGYAIVGFNTLGFKYHHPNTPLPADNERQRREARALNAGFSGIFWPLYWPARWSLLFWEPRPGPITNTVYVTNYVERPHDFPYRVPPIYEYEFKTNYTWQEYKYQPGDPTIHGITNLMTTSRIMYTIHLTNVTPADVLNWESNKAVSRSIIQLQP